LSYQALVKPKGVNTVVYTPSSGEVDNKKRVRAWPIGRFVPLHTRFSKITGTYAKEQSHGDGFIKAFIDGMIETMLKLLVLVSGSEYGACHEGANVV
jgi:hypothetical protein